MEISEDIERALTYELNARLLADLPEHPDGAALTATLLRVLAEEGPRFHEPALPDAWARLAGVEHDELTELLEETLEAIVEELTDAEEPFSAHRILALLAEEPFWGFTFGGSGGQVPTPPSPGTGLCLPLPLRAGIVSVLDQLELTLHEANQAQRSVHDRLDDAFVRGWVDGAVRAIADLGRAHRLPDLLEQLRTGPVPAAGRIGPIARRPPLAEVLEEVQRWKLSVDFDASPDDDDGEWTLRVLERLYDLSWGPASPSATPC